MEGFVCMGFFVKVEDNDEKLHHLINENDDEMKKMIHLVLICRILWTFQEFWNHKCSEGSRN